MKKEVLIKAENISKIYKLYDKKIDRLKEALSISKKKYYNEYYALSDVSFEIYKGEAIGIIGANGAGKSTILKILTGVTTPTTGTVTVKGIVSALLELGAGFNLEYTGMENIYLNGTMMGFSREEMKEKLGSIIKFADIGDFINQPVKNYSSGMFARLAFAVAISVEPNILIVDEALSVGDIFFQNKCFRKIEELKSKGVTILYVSHDLSGIKEMCNRVMWLEKGKMKMYGNCVEVCNEYSNMLLMEKNEIHNDFSTNIIDNSFYEIGKFDWKQFPQINYSNESIISDDVKILSCIVLDKNNKLNNNINAKESCCISVIFESKVLINQCIVGIAISTVKGLWVLNMNTLISGEKKHISIKENSLNRVDFKFEMPSFLEGNYILEAAVSDGVMSNYRTITWLYNIQNIAISNAVTQYALLDIETKINIYSNPV